MQKQVQNLEVEERVEPHPDAVVSCGQFWFLGQMVALRRNRRACEVQAVNSYKMSPLTWYFLEVTSGMRRISTASQQRGAAPSTTKQPSVRAHSPACLSARALDADLRIRPTGTSFSSLAV